jgi:hypothetical protein
VEEEDIVLFVGIIPIAIDVLFKYWIFIGGCKVQQGPSLRLMESVAVECQPFANQCIQVPALVLHEQRQQGASFTA